MKARKVKGLNPDGPLDQNARRIIRVRMRELESFASKVVDPPARTALHDMRIAAKRLRYVLELMTPVLGAEAGRGAKSARRLQDLLGEIHDCDLMLPLVEAHIERLRTEDAAALRELAGGRARDLPAQLVASAPHRTEYRGLETLHSYLRARRELLYQRFLREWAKLEADELWAKLPERLVRRGTPQPPRRMDRPPEGGDGGPHSAGDN